jgi:hypothetical protein
VGGKILQWGRYLGVGVRTIGWGMHAFQKKSKKIKKIKKSKKIKIKKSKKSKKSQVLHDCAACTRSP